MRALRLLAVGMCVAGAAASLVAYRSERRADEVVSLALVAASGEAGARAPDSSPERARRKALDLVSQARLLNPDTNLDVQEGLFLEPNRRRGEAILRAAAAKEPDNVFLWLTLSRLQEQAGRLDAARRSYARAATLDARLTAPE